MISKDDKGKNIRPSYGLGFFRTSFLLKITFVYTSPDILLVRSCGRKTHRQKSLRIFEKYYHWITNKQLPRCQMWIKTTHHRHSFSFSQHRIKRKKRDIFSHFSLMSPHVPHTKADDHAKINCSACTPQSLLEMEKLLKLNEIIAFHFSICHKKFGLHNISFT